MHGTIKTADNAAAQTSGDVNHTAGHDQAVPVQLIWDLPIRLFHWLLVGAVTVAAITGFLAPEWWLDVHSWAGYTIGFLIVFRLVWGFIGSWYSRFASFWFPVHETRAHLQDLVQKKPSHYRGHNPAGALMVFALLGVLASLTLSGLVILGGQENLGALAGYVSFNIGAALVEAHEWLAFGLLALIAAHLVGVLVESLLSRENLVRAMITGQKRSDHSAPLPPAAPAPTKRSTLPRAFLAGAFVLIAGSGAAWSLMRTAPSGYLKLPVNKTYASECGDCHFAYHPSLLPASSWIKMMNTLEDHFGEDASLDKETTTSLRRYLATYSAEKWDSEAANNLRALALRDPMRITATPYWKRRHEAISREVFALKVVGSKGNCIACHKDARTGHFDDQNIAVPDAGSAR